MFKIKMLAEEIVKKFEKEYLNNERLIKRRDEIFVTYGSFLIVISF